MQSILSYEELSYEAKRAARLLDDDMREVLRLTAPQSKREAMLGDFGDDADSDDDAEPELMSDGKRGSSWEERTERHTALGWKEKLDEHTSLEARIQKKSEVSEQNVDPYTAHAEPEEQQ